MPLADSFVEVSGIISVPDFIHVLSSLLYATTGHNQLIHVHPCVPKIS